MLTKSDVSIGEQIKQNLSSDEIFIDPLSLLPDKPKAHAEELLIEYAKRNGYVLENSKIGASKDICGNCKKIIIQEGVINETPFR